MTLRTQILVMVALVFFMIELIYLLRKKELILKYSLIWILITVLLGIGTIAPEPFCDLMGIIGIRYSMNGLFLALLGGAFLILVSLTVIVSRQTLRITRLIQRVAILERALEEQNGKAADM